MLCYATVYTVLMLRFIPQAAWFRNNAVYLGLSVRVYIIEHEFRVGCVLIWSVWCAIIFLFSRVMSQVWALAHIFGECREGQIPRCPKDTFSSAAHQA